MMMKNASKIKVKKRTATGIRFFYCMTLHLLHDMDVKYVCAQQTTHSLESSFSCWYWDEMRERKRDVYIICLLSVCMCFTFVCGLFLFLFFSTTLKSIINQRNNIREEDRSNGRKEITIKQIGKKTVIVERCEEQSHSEEILVYLSLVVGWWVGTEVITNKDIIKTQK